MSLNYLNEAFTELQMLNEEDFNLNDTTSFDDMKSFMDMADDEEDTVEIIDSEAETEDDMQDNYIDKVVLDCVVCHSKIYKSPNEVFKDEIEDVVNVDEECPYCYSHDGFKVIGQIAPFDDITKEPDVEVETTEEEIPNVETDIEVEEEPVEESLDEVSVCPKCGKDPCECENSDEPLTEDIDNINMDVDGENISIYRDNGGVTVETPDNTVTVKPNSETIVPVEPDVEAEIESNEIEPDEGEEDFEVVDEQPVEEVPVEDEFTDVDFDDFDEDSFDDLGESYLKRVYENVDTYKTEQVRMNGNKLTVEGLITFKSGNTKNTQFVFESKDCSKNGKLRFVGENAQITRGKKPFTVQGCVNDKKFVTESFNYNYHAKNTDGKSVRLYGTLKNK